MDNQKLVDSLSPHERKILPYLGGKLVDMCRKSNLDKVSVLRSLEYLQNKEIVKLTHSAKKIVELDVNGALYKKKGLPERRLLTLMDEKRIVPFKDAQKDSSLSADEFKAALGALKKRALIEIKNGKLLLNASKEEIIKKTLEESFLESLPVEHDSLKPEQLFALKSLQTRKNLVELREEKHLSVEVTPLGKELMNLKLKDEELIEQITPEMLKSGAWKGKKFRRYDVTSPLPKVTGGKRHFVNQAIDYARGVWTDMGFKEMSGSMIQSSFWNFDALFTAQDHPVREMQDTFFINETADLPDKELVKRVKQTHEKGISGSKGWGSVWNEDLSKQVVLRTHTTCLSAQTLVDLDKTKLPQKLFALGKNFRNETVDWSHGFEFYQTEGIVVDRDANFRHLLGYLKQFYKKMGFEKIRFTPAYFPYTEPSVEIHVFHPEKKVWLELGGAGIFRPEITVPLLGEDIPVLAWGQGIDRIVMDLYKIKDLRDMYKNNLTQLRDMRFLTK